MKYYVVAGDYDFTHYGCEKESEIIGQVEEALCDGHAPESLKLIEMVEIPMTVQATVYTKVENIRVYIREDAEKHKNDIW